MILLFIITKRKIYFYTAAHNSIILYRPKFFTFIIFWVNILNCSGISVISDDISDILLLLSHFILSRRNHLLVMPIGKLCLRYMYLESYKKLHTKSHTKHRKKAYTKSYTKPFSLPHTSALDLPCPGAVPDLS